jgi:hypothetical protein
LCAPSGPKAARWARLVYYVERWTVCGAKEIVRSTWDGELDLFTSRADGGNCWSDLVVGLG